MGVAEEDVGVDADDESIGPAWIRGGPEPSAAWRDAAAHADQVADGDHRENARMLVSRRPSRAKVLARHSFVVTRKLQASLAHSSCRPPRRPPPTNGMRVRRVRRRRVLSFGGMDWMYLPLTSFQGGRGLSAA
jgi:hypothetical protein